MGQTCNHIAAGMFRIEAAVRNGLTNPACTSASNKWLPCRKEITPMKIKKLNFSRDDFARGRKKRPLLSTPKKKFHPLARAQRNY